MPQRLAGVTEQETEERTVAPRPVDRREHIDRHAAELFVSRGYPATRLEDIAAAVGFTARALYRHYPSKNALLFHLTYDGQEAYFAALTMDATSGVDPSDHLTQALSRLSDVMEADHTHALLWQREARHLDPEQREVVRSRVVKIAEGVRKLIADARNGRPGRSEILAWAVLAVLGSSGHHTQAPAARGRRARERLLVAATTVALSTIGSDESDAGYRLFRNRPALASRREEILQSSARLFRERGFTLVTVDDIGQSIGILGPSVYHHFDSKQSILAALVHRMNEWLTLAILDAQGRGTDARECLDILVRSYVELALNFSDLVSVTLTESLYLADEDAEQLTRARMSLFTTWASMLRGARPELTESTAVALVHATTSVIDDLVRIPHLRNADLPSQLTALARTVLTS